MSDNYCLVLEFYKNDVFVASKVFEAPNLCDIFESLDIGEYDKCTLSGYYLHRSDDNSDSESDRSLIIEFCPSPK